MGHWKIIKQYFESQDIRQKIPKINENLLANSCFSYGSIKKFKENNIGHIFYIDWHYIK